MSGNYARINSIILRRRRHTTTSSKSISLMCLWARSTLVITQLSSHCVEVARCKNVGNVRMALDRADDEVEVDMEHGSGGYDDLDYFSAFGEDIGVKEDEEAMIADYREGEEQVVVAREAGQCNTGDDIAVEELPQLALNCFGC
jgi:hypothetical protein